MYKYLINKKLLDLSIKVFRINGKCEFLCEMVLLFDSFKNG